MIESHRQQQAFADPEHELPPGADGWAIASSPCPAFDESLRSSVERFSASFMRRLGAAAATVLWRDGPRGRPMRLATSGAPQQCPDWRILDARDHRDHGNHPAHWHWQAGFGDEPDWLCIDFSVANGFISVVATMTGEVGKRELVERSLPKLVKEAMPFFEVCGVAFKALELSSQLQGASHALDAGMAIIDREGNVLFANDAAETLGLESGAFRMSGGTLRANTLGDSLCLQTTVDHVIRGSAGRPASDPATVVTLSRPEGRPLMVAVQPIEPSAQENGRTAAVLYFCDPERDLSPAIQPACEFYRLSGVEAKLAQLLVRGLSVAESAIRLKLKEQTARSYLKQIFLKTDTKRQGELVAVLLRGAINSVPNRDAHLLPAR